MSMSIINLHNESEASGTRDISSSRSLATSQPRNLEASQPRSLATSQPRNLEASQPYVQFYF